MGSRRLGFDLGTCLRQMIIRVRAGAQMLKLKPFEQYVGSDTYTTTRLRPMRPKGYISRKQKLFQSIHFAMMPSACGFRKDPLDSE